MTLRLPGFGRPPRPHWRIASTRIPRMPRARAPSARHLLIWVSVQSRQGGPRPTGPCRGCPDVDEGRWTCLAGLMRPEAGG